LKWLGALSEDYAHLLRRGIGGSMYTRKWATLAPRHLQVVLDQQLNPAALTFYERHLKDIC
jgi:hypothetical protein